MNSLRMPFSQLSEQFRSGDVVIDELTSMLIFRQKAAEEGEQRADERLLRAARLDADVAEIRAEIEKVEKAIARLRN